MNTKVEEEITKIILAEVSSRFSVMPFFEPVFVPAANSKNKNPSAYLASILYGDLGPVFLIPEGRCLVGRCQSSDYHYPLLCDLVEAYQWIFECNSTYAEVIDPESEYGSILIKDRKFEYGESTPEDKMISGEGEKLSFEKPLALETGDILVNPYSFFLFGMFD